VAVLAVQPFSTLRIARGCPEAAVTHKTLSSIRQAGQRRRTAPPPLDRFP
jgi:hypothetical protein